MTNHTVEFDDLYIDTARTFLMDVLSVIKHQDFAIRLWDGTVIEESPGKDRRFTLKLNHPGALRKMFFPPGDMTLGEAYIYGDYDVEGDLQYALKTAQKLKQSWTLWDSLKLAFKIWQLPSPKQYDYSRVTQLSGAEHSPERDRQAIQYHYDVSNDFYQLWLDKNMVYSCAYFTSVDDSLDEAQEGKLDYICRKLRLEPGERLLDIGCGWGGLLIHAAKNYGIQGVGITLSENQAHYAKERIEEEGLTSQIEIRIQDYRELDESQAFDKLVSIGMFEHVGKQKLPTYFAKAYRLLKPGGVFLNHGIANAALIKQAINPFINKYVFPDGQVLKIKTTIAVAGENGFEVRDLENLREHYALTLAHWVKRLEAKRNEALKHIDEVGYRIWKIYMSGAKYSFDNGDLNLYQVLLYKPDGSLQTKLPLTRADWYSES